MARKQAGGYRRVYAGVAVAAALIGGGLFWTGRPTATAKLDPGPPPTLPEGALTPAGATVTDARYVALGEAKAGAATVLVVGRTPNSVEQHYAMAVKRELVDCANRTIGQEIVSLYDQDGKLMTSRYETGPAGRAAESADSETTLLCDHVQPPAWRLRAGWRAAQREQQPPPTDSDERLKASPKDPALWAWRCHAVALGQWRPDGRQVCDKALALAPQDVELRVDRGFLALFLGDRKAATHDFDVVVSAHPDNAPALFGRGLAEAMSGAEATSKADRTRALKLDAKVPDWIETNYRISIGAPYRKG